MKKALLFLGIVAALLALEALLGGIWSRRPGALERLVEKAEAPSLPDAAQTARTWKARCETAVASLGGEAADDRAAAPAAAEVLSARPSSLHVFLDHLVCLSAAERSFEACRAGGGTGADAAERLDYCEAAHTLFVGLFDGRERDTDPPPDDSAVRYAAYPEPWRQTIAALRHAPATPAPAVCDTFHAYPELARICRLALGTETAANQLEPALQIARAFRYGRRSFFPDDAATAAARAVFDALMGEPRACAREWAQRRAALCDTK